MTSLRPVAFVLPFSFAMPWMHDVVGRLPYHGWEARVITLSPEGPLHEDLRVAGIRATALGAHGRRDYPFLTYRLARALRSVSLAHAHLLDAALVSTVAGLIARRPVVITRHDSPGFMEFSPVSHFKKALYRSVDAAIIGRAAALIAPSSLVYDELVALGADPLRVHKILLGADMGRLRVADRNRADTLRGELSCEGFTALFVGRLSPEKGVDVLERAWQRVVPTHPNARLLVVGEGPERRYLQRLAGELGIARNVSFLGWRSDAPELMLASDVVAHPSGTESTGLVLLEALALARPLVVTPVGIVNEYLVDRVHCLVVPFGDPSALAEALLSVATSPADAAARAAAGREIAARRSGIEPMVSAYASLYEQLTAQPGRRLRQLSPRG